MSTSNRYIISPTIGIGRVGDSQEYFIASEVPHRPYPGPYRDDQGKLLKQAVRFRVFEVDSQGVPIKEIQTGEGTTIRWTVTLANRKPAGYLFDTRYLKDLQVLRNRAIQGDLPPDERTELINAPPPVSIEGLNQGKVESDPSHYRFHCSRLFNERVNITLGRLETDECGNLIVCGGNGRSKPIRKGPEYRLFHFANNDWWYDDTSDGTVEAEIIVDGVSHTAERAWVLFAPPKYAPAVKDIIPLYQTIGEYSGGWKMPERVEFYRDVAPIFDAPAYTAWVNPLANTGHGPNSKANFLSPMWQDKLRDNSPANAAFRKSLFFRVRVPSQDYEKVTDFPPFTQGQAVTYFMPLLSGDGGNLSPGSPITFLSVTPGMYKILEQWSEGNFYVDEESHKQRLCHRSLSDIPLSERPAALTKAALEWACGGPFCPGIEITYIVTLPESYSAPYRFSDDWKPGYATQLMALPWQADFYECADYWWPAQRPDSVVSFNQYQKAVNSPFAKVNTDVSYHIADKRTKWARGLKLNTHNNPVRWGDQEMAKYWKKLGFVVPVPASRPKANIVTVSNGKNFQKELDKVGWDFRISPSVFIEVERQPLYGINLQPRVCNTIQDLKVSYATHLRWAMQLELTTIPAYLAAMYCLIEVKDSDNPFAKKAASARQLIKTVVIEEMLHLSLIANILTAIGARPVFYDEQAIPNYPTVLPHASASDTLITLGSPTKSVLEAFLMIERPQTPDSDAQGNDYRTQGQFYEYIIDITKQQPEFFPVYDNCTTIDPDDPRIARQLLPGQGYFPHNVGTGGLVEVKDSASALEALSVIREQGEGSDDLTEFSHYAKFKLISEECDFGPFMINASGVVTGEALSSLPDDDPIPLINNAFNASYSYLLMILDRMYATADSKSKLNIILSGLYIAMDLLMRPLAQCLLSCPLPSAPGEFACPTFYFHKYSSDEAAKSELIALVTAANNATNRKLQSVVENAKVIYDVALSSSPISSAELIGMENAFEKGYV